MEIKQPQAYDRGYDRVHSVIQNRYKNVCTCIQYTCINVYIYIYTYTHNQIIRTVYQQSVGCVTSMDKDGNLFGGPECVQNYRDSTNEIK